jgi:hypothetical protein
MGEAEFAAHRAAFWAAADSAEECTIATWRTDGGPVQSVEHLHVEQLEAHATDNGRVVLRIVTGDVAFVVSIPAGRAVAWLSGASEVARDAERVPRGSAYR